MTASAPEAPVDLAALGQVVHEETLRLRAEEQKIVRGESEIQTMLARRRFPNLNEILAKRYRPEHLGAPQESPKNLPPPASRNSSSRAISINRASKPKKTHVPRPGVTQMLQEAWATPEGQGKLLGLSLRALGSDFGVRHSTIRENPFFVQKILPLRMRTRLAQKAAGWMEKNARSRP